MKDKLKKMAAIVTFPVVKEVAAIKIMAMKKKHFEQIELVSRVPRDHEILGLVEEADGWLVIRVDDRLVRCSLIRYLEPQVREDAPFEDRNDYYNHLADRLRTTVPQLFQD